MLFQENPETSRWDVNHGEIFLFFIASKSKSFNPDITLSGSSV